MYDDLPDVDEIQDLSTARSLLKQLYLLIKPLQSTNESLQTAIEQLQETIARQTDVLEQQRAEIAELRRMLFGQRSEKIPPLEQEARRRGPGTAKDPKATQAKRRRRRKQRSQLATEDKKHDVPDDACHCPHCRGPFRDLGEGEVSYEIDFVPARFAVIKHIRQRQICRCGQTIVVAPAPDRVSDGIHYGPGFHAQVAVAKCVDAMPLYRQARQLQRAGIPISRSTLCDLFHRTAELLGPLYKAMLDEIARQPHVHADETPIRRLRPGGTRRSFIWAFVTDDLVAFEYTPGRSGKTPERILGASSGTLQVDGYTGYNAVCTPAGRTRAGCWAHVRRYFWKARATDPDDAQWMLDRIHDLYVVEYLAADRGLLRTDAHRAMRRRYSAPIVDEITLWLEQERDLVPPKSPLGKAYTYLANQLESLGHFLDDPRIALDNNVSERMLRTIAIGRKNFLFVGNDAAGRNHAVLQSLVTSCEINGVNPVEYLADVLIRVQSHPTKRVDELLPNRWAELKSNAA